MSNTEEMRKLINLYENTSIEDIVADINSSGETNTKEPAFGDDFLMIDNVNNIEYPGRIVAGFDPLWHVQLYNSDGSKWGTVMKFMDSSFNTKIKWDSKNNRWVRIGLNIDA